MKRDYMVFFRDPKSGKVIETFYAGTDCLNVLEGFTDYYQRLYETQEKPIVEAIRRADYTRPYKQAA